MDKKKICNNLRLQGNTDVGIRQKRKTYRKLLKTYKKKLVKLAKRSACSPYDYGYMLDFFLTNLELMKKYYENGYNVQQNLTNPDNHEAISAIAEALDLYHQYDNVMKDYVDVNDGDVVEDPKTHTIHTVGIKYKYPDDIQRCYKEGSEVEEKAWHEFWECVEKYIRGWWD